MNRQSTILAIIFVIAVALIIAVASTRNSSRASSLLPGVAPAQDNSATPANASGSPCVPQTPSSPKSVTNTATTTDGTTPDGRPTGAFVGQPCVSGTHDNVPPEAPGNPTASQHKPGEPGSGVTHGPDSGR